MKTYPSKILLFGEYTIIRNSSALAMPYKHYQSFWSDEEDIDPEFKNYIDEDFSKNCLQNIFEDLKKLKKPRLVLAKMRQQLDDGLWFSSDAPLGYGLGSSGAISAAIYERYVQKKATKLPQLKQELARIENSFHGKSSGIDPLISYTNSALWVHADKSIEKVTLPESLDKGTIFLVNSNQPRVSTPLINFFMEQCKDPDFIEEFVQPVSESVEKAIQALINNDFPTLIYHASMISELEFMYLPPMVTLEMRDLWMLGIESQEFYLKICGAGGGGFILGFTEDWENVKHYFEDYETKILF
ncbi:MAG: hypothetical protein MK207_13940 [Saprospiraceae bacterium]|nr:hypothetical protein [Saprospiraceae bacterium]